jgi:hypothetical protein
MAVLRAPDGRLYEAPDDQAEALQRDQGMVPASPEELAQSETERERYSQYGGTGQQALGLAETFARSATLGGVEGLVPGESEEARRARAQVVQEESPVATEIAAQGPGIVAGVGAAALTGGASLPLLMGVEGAIGGAGALGAAQDEAFRHDQELSAEAALGTFAQGAVLGAGTAGVLTGAGRAFGGIRNRFVEASGRAARQAEKEAFEAAGIRRPEASLGKAVNDPVERAAVIERGTAARTAVHSQLGEELRAAEAAEAAVRQAPAPVAGTAGDIGAQRAAAREVIMDARYPAPEASARALVALDEAQTGDQVFEVVRGLRGRLDDALQGAEKKEAAEALQKVTKAARELEGNDALFGSPATGAVARREALEQVASAKEALRQELDGNDYLGKVGLADADGTENALDAYLDRLGSVLKSSEAPEASAGLEAIARLRSLRNGELREVAAANQARALRPAKTAAGGGSGMVRDMLGELAETAVESVIPGAGILRKAFKYRKHIARLAGMARKDAEGAAEAVVGSSAARAGGSRTGYQRAKAIIDRQRGQSGGVNLSRGGKWQSATDIERRVDDAIRGFDDDEVLAELTTAGDVRKHIYEQVESDLYEQDLVGSEGLTKAQRAELKAAVKAAVDDIGDVSGLSARARSDVDAATAERYAALEPHKREAIELIRGNPSTAPLTARFGGAEASDLLNMLVDSGEIERLPYVHGQGTRYQVTGSKPRGGELGAVSIGRGPNFSLGDVAKSPMGVVTAAGGAALGLRSLDLSAIDKDQTRAYRKLRSSLELLAKEPERLAESLAADMGDMVHDAPELVQQIAGKAQKIVDYLQSKLPPSFAFSIMYPEGPEPSRTDILEMALHWHGATQPQAVLKAIGDGTAMPEEVAAFRAINPAWFDEFRDATHERLAIAAKEGAAIGAYRIAQLETLLDMPGGVDPAFSDRVAGVANEAKMKQAQQEQAPSYAPQPRAGQRIEAMQSELS